MSASPPIFSKTWKVGKRTVTLDVPKPQGDRMMSATMQWTPDMPARLNKSELREYMQGRDAALEAVSNQLGISIALVEL